MRESSEWLSKVNKKGEIFELEVEPVHDTSFDKEGICTCSDCATDDTGYGTDTDNGYNFRRLDVDVQDNCHKVTSEFDVIDQLLGIGTAGLGDSGSGSLSGDFRNIEENIDSLFTTACAGSNSEIETLKSEAFDIPDNIEDLFADGFSDLKTLKSKSKCDKSKKSATMTNPDSSSRVVRKDISKHSRESVASKLNESNCSCSSKGSLRGNETLYGAEKCVVLRLNYLTGDIPCNTIELCEQFLGIIPGHFSSSSGSTGWNRKRDRRVKIRGLVPTGIAAKYQDVKVGRYQPFYLQ